MDANEMFDTIMRELTLSERVTCEPGDAAEEQRSFWFPGETDPDDIPPSLLSYLHTSKNRAAVCEKVLQQDLEDVTASRATEDATFELHEEKRRNEQAGEEDRACTDTRLLPAAHGESVCASDEVEYKEKEKHLEYKAEQMKKEERKSQIESDFQAELRKLMDAEKLQQKELELMGRRAQENLKQEFLLQQELISSLQRRVEEERKKKEEEQERIMEAQMRRKKEEEDRKLKEEEDRKCKEEEKVRVEREEKRKREDERNRKELRLEDEKRIVKEKERKQKEEEEERKREEERKKKIQDNMRMMKEEEKRKQKEEEEERKREEERKKKIQDNMRMMKEEEKRKQKEEEEERKREEERKKVEDKMRMMKEEEERKQKEEEEERKGEEERKKKIQDNMRMMKEEEKRKQKEEEEERKREEERKKKIQDNMRMMKEEEKRKQKEEEEERKREEERKKVEDKMRMMKEEEERKQKEEEEERKGEEERKKKIQDKMRMMKEEEERKQKEEEEERKGEEERKKVEDKMRMMKEEEERKQKEEDEERKMEEVRKKKVQDKLRMMKEEEERKQKKKEEERKKEEQRKKTVQEKKKLEDKMRMMVEEERKKKEEEENRKSEEERKKKVEKKTREENRRIEEEFGITKKIEEMKKQEAIQGKNEEEALIKLKEERRRRDEKEHDDLDELLKLKKRKTKEESDGERREEKEASKKEKETKYIEEKKDLTEVRRIKGDGDGKKDEEPKPVKEDEQSNRKDERRLKEEEQRRRLKEETKAEDQEGYRKSEEEIKPREEQAGCEGYQEDTKIEQETKTKEQKLEEEKRKMLEAEEQMKEEGEIRLKEREESTQRATPDRTASASSAPSHPQPAASGTGTGDEENLSRTSTGGAAHYAAFLPPRTEERRLAWMKDCVSWSKLSLQNRSRQDGPARRRRGPGGAPGSGGLPPLCPDSVLRAAGQKSLQEVTSVTLQDLPGRCLSTLARCDGLRTLTLRRCGLKRLDAIKQLPQLCCVDVQENDISYVDCENMSSLRVLQLGRNKLTSIHGLTGAVNLDLLDLSHNSITRIAGLESTRRLQRLSLDHNHLISTKGLRDVYTLLHLSCSHNHLASVEGLENSALLHTLDLRGNSLAEPPSLKNQVLLRELRLDDNSLSSLQGLAACWLPLMQRLSAAQNRITQLPPMSHSVSLASLDLRFNCVSELRNVCDSLEGCASLRELHLQGNPVQQERGWRAALQSAAPGLMTIDGQRADSAPRRPAARCASGGFLELCQAQLQRTLDLQRQHSGELRSAASPLDAARISCRHLTEVLQLAEDQRVAHECGDAAVGDAHPTTAGETIGQQSQQSNNRPLALQTTAAVMIQQLWRKYRQKCGNISSFATAEKGGGGGAGAGGDGGGGDGGQPSLAPSSVSGSVVGPDRAATVIQACWRGGALRRRLAAALAAVTREDDALEEVDVQDFVFDEDALEEPWTWSSSEDSPPRRCPSSESLKLPGCFPESSTLILPPPLARRPREAWLPGEQVEASPDTSGRRKSTASTSESKAEILEEWGFTDSNTALQMLKRAQRMKRTTQRQKKRQDTSGRLAFRNCGYPPGPISARKRPAQHNRSDVKETGREAEPGLRTAGAERAEWGGAQAAHSGSDSESVRFLPQISPNVLKGGRVQLVGDPGHTAAAAARPSGESPGRTSSAPPGSTVASPRRLTSAPSKRERMSHRDAAVRRSGGWGGGRKRDGVN